MFYSSLRSASQYRAHAGEQFGKGKLLDEIIVRAQLESLHTVAHTVAGGKKKNRRASPIAAEFRDHFPAVLVWQHDIDDKKIKFGSPGFLQTGLAIARDLNRKTGFAEPFREETRRFLFVLNNENPHMF